MGFYGQRNPNGSVARLKTRIVAKEYAQKYGVYYSDTFSPVAKLNSIHLFILSCFQELTITFV